MSSYLKTGIYSTARTMVIFRACAMAMELCFLGTSSAMPSATRNVSALAWRTDGDVWLFDAGEATQHQIAKTSLKMSKISRILISHLHGDHVYGLPGLLCTMGGQGRGGGAGEEIGEKLPQQSDESPLELIGPAGLRRYVRATLQLSYARLGYPIIIHELHWPVDSTAAATVPTPSLQIPALESELPGQDIMLDAEGIWRIPPRAHRANDTTLIAAPIDHSVPTVGFVITESPVPGTLNATLAKAKLEDNRAALLAQGIKQPLQLLKKLKDGEIVPLPDGTVLDPAELVSPPLPGRKVVLLGDTFNPYSPALIAAAQGCDVLVHEATNAYLPDDAATASVDEEQKVEMLAVSHGHSTPQMAGKFATAINAKALCLTHFSSRYRGDVKGKEVMDAIGNLAMRSFALGPVICARDLMTLSITRNGITTVVPE